MIAVVRSEWVKLRTTSVPWILTGIALFITGLSVLLYFLNHGNTGGGPNGHRPDIGFGPPHPGYPHTTQQLRDLLGTGLGSYVFALLLGVLIITTEFRHKTVTTSFLVTPRRPVFVAGKLVLAALAGAVLALIVLGATLVGGGIALASKGGSFSALVHQLGAVAPGMVLVYVLFGLLGVGVGSLITNQVAAIVISLVWFFILENIVGAIWTSTVRWLPSGAASAAANVTAGRRDATIGLFTWWQGSLLILAYGLVFAGIGSLVLTRRDIT